MDQQVMPPLVLEESKKAEDKYGNLPRKKIKPAKDKKVLPDSIEIARDLEFRRILAEQAKKELSKKNN